MSTSGLVSDEYVTMPPTWSGVIPASAMAALTLGSSRTVIDTCAPPRIAAATVG